MLGLTDPLTVFVMSTQLHQLHLRAGEDQTAGCKGGNGLLHQDTSGQDGLPSVPAEPLG